MYKLKYILRPHSTRGYFISYTCITVLGDCMGGFLFSESMLVFMKGVWFLGKEPSSINNIHQHVT